MSDQILNLSETESVHATPLSDSNFIRIVSPLLEKAISQIYVTTFKMELKDSLRAQKLNKLLRCLFAAHDKDVDVRVMMNFNHHKKSTASINWYAAKVLARRGIYSRYINTSRTLHSKIITVDDRFSIIGSHNFSILSHDKNIELSVILESIPFTGSLNMLLDSYWSKAVLFPGINS